MNNTHISPQQPEERTVKKILVSVGDGRLGRPYVWALVSARKFGRCYKVSREQFDQLVVAANQKR